jgi:hypothetical protein
VAVGGLAIALYFEIRRRRGAQDGNEWIKLGCNWFTGATIINFGIGLWFLGVLPKTAYNPETLGSKIFILLVIGSVAAIIPAMASAQTGRIIRATVWTLITILLMTVARDVLRLTYLKPYFSLSDLPYVPQYSPFIVFLLAVAGAIYIVVWMLKVVWNTKEVS